MSAEALVESIINKALATAAKKAELADTYSERAITASMGSSSSGFSGIVFSPNAVEPPVTIPANAVGVDGALYNTAYGKIITDLSDKFAGFFSEYFPNECDYLQEAQVKLCEMLEGGTGIPTHVEAQIWQRDRSRVLEDVNRARDDVLATFASRGFPLPPGAAAHAMRLAEVDANNKIAQQSRDVAIKHVDILIENIKFAVQQALDYRIKGIAAAGEYIKVLALGPEIAMKLATSAAGAQAQLISAASQYYRNRIAIEELRLDAAKFNAATSAEVSMNNVREFSNRLKARTDTLAAAARAAGDQAAAALNAVHASAQVAVQGETA